MPDAMSQLVGPAGISTVGHKTESVPKEECSPPLFSLVRHDSALELSNLSEIVATRGSSPPRAAREPPHPHRISGDFHTTSPNQVGELCNSNLPPRCPGSEYQRLVLREGSWFPCTSLTGHPRLDRISESFAEPTVETKDNSSFSFTQGRAGDFALAGKVARSPCTSLMGADQLERISDGLSLERTKINSYSCLLDNKLLNPGDLTGMNRSPCAPLTGHTRLECTSEGPSVRARGDARKSDTLVNPTSSLGGAGWQPRVLQSSRKEQKFFSGVLGGWPAS